MIINVMYDSGSGGVGIAGKGFVYKFGATNPVGTTIGFVYDAS